MKLRWLVPLASLGLVAAFLAPRARSGPGVPAAAPAQVTTPSAAAEPAPTGALRIAVEDAAGPWSLPDGSGFANDVVVAAFKASGVEVALDVVPYARCKQMAVEGTAVGCFSMSASPGLDTAIAFADAPLFICDVSYFQRTDRPLAARSERELPRGTIVGTVLGYEYPDSLLQLQRDGHVVLEPSGSEEINLRKLADGRIDAAVITVNGVKTPAGLTARAGLTGKVSPAFSSGTLRSFLGFSRRHPRGAAAREQFNAGYQTIRANGTLARIEQAWTRRTTDGGLSPVGVKGR